MKRHEALDVLAAMRNNTGILLTEMAVGKGLRYDGSVQKAAKAIRVNLIPLRAAINWCLVDSGIKSKCMGCGTTEDGNFCSHCGVKFDV